MGSQSTILGLCIVFVTFVVSWILIWSLTRVLDRREQQRIQREKQQNSIQFHIDQIDEDRVKIQKLIEHLREIERRYDEIYVTLRKKP